LAPLDLAVMRPSSYAQDVAELSGEPPRKTVPCKSVGVEEDHQIAASRAQVLATAA
jgi:hypothetical protein